LNTTKRIDNKKETTNNINNEYKKYKDYYNRVIFKVYIISLHCGKG
jgi:hypothetical protein